MSFAVYITGIKKCKGMNAVFEDKARNEQTGGSRQ